MKNWAFIFLLFYLSGCGVAIVPKPDQTGQIDLQSRIITKKVGGVSVSVQTHEWQFNPPELEQYFTPFLFLIRNETENKISLNLKGIFLVDPVGNQFKPVISSEVEKSMMDRGYVITPSARLGMGMGGHRSFVGIGLDFPLNSSRPMGSDIASLSLPEGEVLSGAAVRGFVYFQRAVPAGDSLKIHFEINQASEEFYFLLKR
jgi:hypothetical protein